MSSTTNDTTTTDTAPGDTVMIIMYSIILILSLVGNVLVIAVVCGNKNLRTVFNSFIVNMAVSDLFVPFLAIPIRLVDVTKNQGIWLIRGDLGSATCKLFIFLIDISPGVTVASLVIIAVNRFVAIVKPMSHAELFSFKRCKILIAMTWVSMTIFFSPYFHIARIRVLDGYNVCDNGEWIEPFDSVNSHIIFQYFLIIVFFLAPFATITILYSIIIYKLHTDSKTVVQMLDSEEARKRKVRNKHVFFLSVAMILAFAIFWGPFFVLLLVNLISENALPSEAFITVQFLGYTNAAVNPLIYFIFLGKFRSGLKRLFCRCLDKEANGSPSVCNTRSVLITKENGHEERIKLKTLGNSANKQDGIETSKGNCDTGPKEDGIATSREDCSSKL